MSSLSCGVRKIRPAALAGAVTLNTTALIHEAYLKLIGQERLEARSRAHFFAVAATVMRHILCNYARDRSRKRRGGDLRPVPLDALPPVADQLTFSSDDVAMLVGLDRALRELEREDQRLSKVVECRFFAAMSIEETATALGTSPGTVKRQWLLARTWLYRRMEGQSAG